MSSWQAGDTATLRLDVTPADDTTQASVVITAPSGAQYEPLGSPDGSRDQWIAHIALDEPGIWHAAWTVTGTGAGAEPDVLRVAPAPGSRLAGRAYATTADLANYTGEAPPANAGQLLRDASASIDGLLIGAWYRTDEQGLPTDPQVAEALLDATVVQAAHAAETGGMGGAGGQVTIGSVSLSVPASGLTGSRGESIAAGAVDALTLAGLLPIRPWVVG